MNKFSLSLVIFLLSSNAGAVSVQSFENDVADEIKNLAMMQFGTSDNVAVKVKAEMILPPKEKPAAESIDVGYLPTPVVVNSKGLGEEAPQSDDFKVENLRRLNVSLFVNSLIDRADAQTFRNTVSRYLRGYKASVSMTAIPFVEPKLKPSELEKLKPKPVPPVVDELNKKDYLYSGTFLAGIVILFMGLFLVFVYMGKIISKAVDALTSAFFTVKQNQKDAASGAVEGADKKLKTAEDFASLNANISKLSLLAKKEAFKMASTLSASLEDQVGLKWMLSKMSEGSRDALSVYLGEQKIRDLKKVEAPADFNYLDWTNLFIEKLTIKIVEGKHLFEEVLTSEQIGRLFAMKSSVLFDVAREVKESQVWRIVLEILDAEEMSQKSNSLDESDWQVIIESRTLKKEQLVGAFEKIESRYKVLDGTDQGIIVDQKSHSKIIDSLVSTVKNMEFGKDEEFLSSLKRTQVDLYNTVIEHVWTYANLKRLEKSSFAKFINGLNNEQTFSLLISVSESERQSIIDQLPDGMKRSVVLDLLEKFLKSPDVQNLKFAQGISKKVIEMARLEHKKGTIQTVREVTA